MTQITLVTHIP
ncbi:hypothetical protein ECEC1847_3413, partial [Escherichia coli EC1847]